MKTRNNRKFKNKTKKFLYNPNNPKKSFDVYIDKNPKDTIHIKYTTLEDVKNTIAHLENLYKHKKYTHKRIWQVVMIMRVRLKVLINYFYKFVLSDCGDDDLFCRACDLFYGVYHLKD